MIKAVLAGEVHSTIAPDRQSCNYKVSMLLIS